MIDTAPKAIYLKDYEVPDFLIETVDLKFDLYEEGTTVTSRLQVKRNPQSKNTPSALVLKGTGLTLESIALDGNVLSEANYQLTKKTLTISDVLDDFVLEMVTEIKPQRNTALEGLYKSSGNFCTQCEAEGFRRITFFLDRPDVMAIYTTTMIADKSLYPVLLSNGNKVDHGDIDNNRHWVKWYDPHPKPSYLFALVAGHLVCQEDEFMTRSGRQVALRIYVEQENEDRCDHALASLKQAMKWDEAVYGREYDLDTFMIVAVNDFNMGAMENKGLNIFNAACVLAKPETATDQDYENIQGIIAHEYFHNWSGNRVTCRDWFQLSLKEGFTVFRDQQFSADMNSAAVTRINQVNILRTTQFPQDAGPMAHPIKPTSYIDISNFYTVTVYNKGAEVVRMAHRLLGADGFKKGTDLYFSLYDGQAVTTDDFVTALDEANGKDLRQFKRWYDQAGTPEVTVAREYDAIKQEYMLEFKQFCPATPDQQEKKQALHIPVNMGLIDRNGHEIELRVKTAEPANSVLLSQPLLEVTDYQQRFTFVDVQEEPVPSLFRDFSAPIKLQIDYSDEELLFLMAADSNAFNRWEAGQRLASRILNGYIDDIKNGRELILSADYVAAVKKILLDTQLDKALIAQALSFPNEIVLAEEQTIIDPVIIHEAREFLCDQIAYQLKETFWALYHANLTAQDYVFNTEQVAQRHLKNLCLSYLVRIGDDETIQLAVSQCRSANNMTDGLAALHGLSQIECEARSQVLSEFYDNWQHDPLVIDKWFTLQARSKLESTLSEVQHLVTHAAFDLKNPNRVRALIGAFAFGNPVRFHEAEGQGYVFLGEQILKLIQLNPQIAARLATAFNQWKRFDQQRQHLMQVQLERIRSADNLPRDVYEIVSKTLGE